MAEAEARGPVIVIAEHMEAATVRSLRARFPVHYDPELFDHPAQLHATLVSARALIVRNRTRVDADLLGQARRLEVIGRLGVGLDNIDLGACRRRAIAVHRASGLNARAVAEYVLAMLLITLRNDYHRTAELSMGRWPSPYHCGGREAAGKTLGLVGFGTVGQLTAGLARAIGCRVVACDPAHAPDSTLWAESGVQPLSFHGLLTTADVVSLHLPPTPLTRHLFDHEAIAHMKQGAILINTAHGDIVDESALASALRSGHLAGAAIDVFSREPLPADSTLAGLPNVWLTPHIAGLSREANPRISAFIAEQVCRSLCRVTGNPAVCLESA
ncbi:MAG TPA: hydroxyacid dehydrogenase [Accumulibacter sp.]|uniref:hydroxyacid dehydrogenase n=1 Tax=Accumulibacter sp. TaxID=2053492 RepID=UPI0025DCF8B4|nr:hydroxyacid dehydrogenase [Accumulibacter sp.]MCM8599504.1 hydroxyacid dehydrogenase [Accumulibacter sp.]MCM8663743.1 hydroxyacid dehydrogenase [Accumulibacter sp.]HNC53252.1 hydroxyacid dehydrogenase [Accumulibacter sp.]